MEKLFERCLGASYKSTPHSGNYSIEADGDTVYLLFEWSHGFLDWVHNFLFPAKPYKRMNCIWFCHRGFLKVWKAMRDEIEAEVNKILARRSEIKNIICVGYSHGGAISLLATEDMEYLYGDRLNVTGYGFGAPRVVWGFIPREFKYRLRNFKIVRNIPDLVTHVPPVIFGFRHVGMTVKIGKLGRYSPLGAHYAGAYRDELEGVPI